jgi:hypothetical protein
MWRAGALHSSAVHNEKDESGNGEDRKGNERKKRGTKKKREDERERPENAPRIIKSQNTSDYEL